MYYQIRKSLSSVLPMLILALAFMSVQFASANGNEVAIEMIVLQAERQRVDTDGDGEMETFSADLTVHADGTAEGFIQLDNSDVVVVEHGSIVETAAGDLTVHINGTSLQSGLIHSLHFSFDPSTANGGGDDDDGVDIILWDIVDGVHERSFDVAVDILIQ